MKCLFEVCYISLTGLTIPLRMWNIDPHSWTGTTDPNLRNEMLQEDLWHLIQRQNHKRRRQKQSQGGHWTTRWPPVYSQDQETEVVWTCYTSNRNCKHHHAWHSTRWEETRQTKEMLARQHQGMDGAASLAKTLRLAEDKDGWRKIIKTSVVPLQPPLPLPPPPPLQRLRAADADDEDWPVEQSWVADRASCNLGVKNSRSELPPLVRVADWTHFTPPAQRKTGN